MRVVILASAAFFSAGCESGPRSVDSTAAGAADTASPESSAPAAGTQLASQSALRVVVEPVEAGNAPAELLLTDPSGRRSGRDPRVGFNMNEIEGASYDSVPAATADPSSAAPPLAKQLTVPTPAEGAYEILVVGTRPGPLTLGIQLSMPDGGRRAVAVQGLQTDRNAARRFRFSYARSDTGAIILSP